MFPRKFCAAFQRCLNETLCLLIKVFCVCAELCIAVEEDDGAVCVGFKGFGKCDVEAHIGRNSLYVMFGLYDGYSLYVFANDWLERKRLI